MEFRVEECPDGFQIIQTKPVVVGTFSERDVARKVMKFLVDEAMIEAADAREEAAASDSAGPNIVPVDWTTEELEAAFMRLAAGEKLRDIADQIGKSWTSLRASWAQENRTKVAVVTDAVALDNCSLCGKEFNPGSDGNTLCARCSR